MKVVHIIFIAIFCTLLFYGAKAALGSNEQRHYGSDYNDFSASKGGFTYHNGKRSGRGTTHSSVDNDESDDSDSSGDEESSSNDWSGYSEASSDDGSFTESSDFSEDTKHTSFSLKKGEKRASSSSRSVKKLLKMLKEYDGLEVVTDDDVERFIQSINLSDSEMVAEIKNNIFKMLDASLERNWLKSNKMWVFKTFIGILEKIPVRIEIDDMEILIHYIIRQNHEILKDQKRIHKSIQKIVLNLDRSAQLPEDTIEFIDEQLVFIREGAASVLLGRTYDPKFGKYPGFTEMRVADAYLILVALLNRNEGVKMPKNERMPRIVQNVIRLGKELELLKQWDETLKGSLEQFLKKNTKTISDLESKSQAAMDAYITTVASARQKLIQFEHGKRSTEDMTTIIYSFYSAWKHAFVYSYCGEHPVSFEKMEPINYSLFWKLRIWINRHKSSQNKNFVIIDGELNNYRSTLFYQMNEDIFNKFHE